LQEPLISVIVPIYNVEKYLNRCIDSIINQTYRNLEIILVDDGSPDNCPKICDEYAKKDSRIIVIHKKNTGVSETRNFGLKYANGDYITFVDSDDWIDSDMYSYMMNYALTSNCDIIKCGYRKCFSNGDKIDIETPFYDNSIIEDINEILYLYTDKKIHAEIVTMLIKKEFIKNKIYFDKKIKLGEDLIFAIELFCGSNRILFLNKSFYNYFTNLNSVTQKKEYKMRNIEDLLDLYDKIISILKGYININKYLYFSFANLCFDKIYEQIYAIDSIKYRKNAIDYVKNETRFIYLLSVVDFKKLRFVNKIFYLFVKLRLLNLFNVLISVKRKFTIE